MVVVVSVVVWSCARVCGLLVGVCAAHCILRLCMLRGGCCVWLHVGVCGCRPPAVCVEVCVDGVGWACCGRGLIVIVLSVCMHVRRS